MAARSRTRPQRQVGVPTREFALLAATVATLLVIGLVMTFSASFVRSAADTGGAFDIFWRQLLWCLLGLPLMTIAVFADYRVWRRLAPVLLAGALAASVLVLIPGLGVVAHGARRWLELGPITFQPSELLKLAVALFTAHVLALRWRRIRAGDLRALLLPAAPAIALAALLVLAGPDLETAGLIAIIGGIVLTAAGLPLRYVAVGAAATVALAVAAIAATPFRRARVLAWLDPMAHADTFGYQSVQGLIALGSGGWFGAGLGEGRGKWLYIPNAHTDFVYAILGEELGLVGALFVLVLFAVLVVVGLRVARRAADPFGRLLAAGVVGWIGVQAALNMASVVGLAPVTGVTLPLVSFGGSSLVVTMVGLGLLLSVARRPRPAPADDEADGSGAGRGGEQRR